VVASATLEAWHASVEDFDCLIEETRAKYSAEEHQNKPWKIVMFPLENSGFVIFAQPMLIGAFSSTWILPLDI
jgi:hypothetical protein